MFLAAALAPLGGATLDPPTLDWFEKGRTFDYRLTDGTTSAPFNATITKVTADTVTFAFWDTIDGEDRTLYKAHLKKTREELNLTGGWSILWINSTDVVSGTATIGGQSYALNTLLSGPEVRVFESDDSNLTWTFDTEKGWLEKVEDAANSNVWILDSVHVKTSNEVEGLRNQVDIDDRYCNPPNEPEPDNVIQDHAHSEDPGYSPGMDAPGLESTFQVCVFDKQTNANGNLICSAEVVAATQEHWYLHFYGPNTFWTFETWTPDGLIEASGDTWGHDGSTFDWIPNPDQFTESTPLVWDLPLWIHEDGNDFKWDEGRTRLDWSEGEGVEAGNIQGSWTQVFTHNIGLDEASDTDDDLYAVPDEVKWTCE